MTDGELALVGQVEAEHVRDLGDTPAGRARHLEVILHTIGSADPGPVVDHIIRLLIEWCERLEAQDAGTVTYNDDDYHSGLERDLMGAVVFLKQVASKCDELELLGLVTKIEMRLDDKVTKEIKAQDEHTQSQIDAYERIQRKREECRSYLSEIPAVDVSKYHDLVAAAKIEDRQALYSLYRYLDETRILKSIKAAVIPKFVYEQEELDPEDLIREFARELQDFYRRADKTVPDRIAKALHNEGRSESTTSLPGTP